MSPIGLDALHLEQGIANVNFFNGRILSADDLRALQRADRRHRALLGRGIGSGIADGLRVRHTSGGVLTVKGGSAVNRLGETIELPDDVDVTVTGMPSPSSGADAGLFAECEPGTSESVPATFLLAVRPGSVLGGGAPASDLLGNAVDCGPGTSLEGVRFRRVSVPVSELTASAGLTGGLSSATASQRSLTRNVLAHLHLGTPWLNQHLRNPLATDPKLDAAWSSLARCEVPLAIFVVQGGSVTVLDEWGVRRPCLPEVDPVVQPERLAAYVSSRRARTGEAAFLQFQAQLTSELAGRAALLAGDDFAYLPAAGVLPATESLVSAGQQAELVAVEEVPFFAGVSYEVAPVPLAQWRVEEVIRTGTSMAPMDLTGAVAPPHVVVFGVPDGAAADAPLPYVVFVRADHPAVVVARLRELEDDLIATRARLEVLEQPDEERGRVRLIYRGQPSPQLAPRARLSLPFSVAVGAAGTYDLSVEAVPLHKAPVPVDLLHVQLDGPATVDLGEDAVHEVDIVVSTDIGRIGGKPGGSGTGGFGERAAREVGGVESRDTGSIGGLIREGIDIGGRSAIQFQIFLEATQRGQPRVTGTRTVVVTVS